MACYNHLGLLRWVLILLFAGTSPEGVWTGPGASHLGGVSRDGRLISGIDAESGNLVVRNLASGEERRVTHKSGSKEFAYFSAISPDSKWIAYAWFNDDAFYDLRIANVQTGESRTLFRNEEAGFVQPCAFSPDSKQILTLLFRKDNISQIALISALDGSVRVLKSLNWVYPKKMDFSPDGRWIAYDNFAYERTPQRDIFLLAADGSREVRLVENPAEDGFPVFSADGARVYFLSDREDGPAVWSITVANRKLERIHAAATRTILLGATRSSLYYAVRHGGAEIYRTTIDLAVGQLTTRPEKIGEGTSVSISPDGAQIAWLARYGTENFGADSRYIAIRKPDGKIAAVTPKLAHIEKISWSGDGKGILASGSDGKGRAGVYRVDVATASHALAENAPVEENAGPLRVKHDELWLVAKTGEPKRVAKAATPIESIALHPDGKTLLFTAGRPRSEVFALNLQ